jgi:hypothetical protein
MSVVQIKKNDLVIRNAYICVLFQIGKMGENVITSSALTDVAEIFKHEVPENNVNSDSDTAVPENDVNIEPEWYRDGDAWVKLFLEPIEPGKFKQHDYVYDVPGENEFPKERWSSEERRDGFHITRRKDVWRHLSLHDYNSAYIAEVVSMGDEFYDSPVQLKRKVRVVTFGLAVPLTEVLGKHPDDFKNVQTIKWSVINNHLEMVKLAASNTKEMNYFYRWEFEIVLKNGNEQITDFLIKNSKEGEERQEMLCHAIRYGRVDLVKRLLENMPVDVRFFEAACESGQFEIFQLLRAKYGEPKCSDIIYEALEGGDVKILEHLKSRGVDMTDFGMFVYACTDYDYSVETVKYLVSEGADVNHPLIAYIASRYAREEVRKFLLDQIEDKSEVPRCKRIEREIEEICDIFYKRIEAGEFDGESN